MFKFFRNTRLKMMDSNKFTKYLLYAIGEIALVVIGILIALQINNWNENRKNRLMETEYLTRLLDDIKEDEFYLNVYFNYSKQVGNRIIRALGYFQDKEAAFASPTQALIDLYQASQILDAVALNSTYKELIAAGHIGLLQNNQLKQHIINYYENQWNHSVIISLPNSYRETLRRYMPPDIQDKIRENCGDIYKTTENRFWISLPEECDITISEENAKEGLEMLLKNPAIKQDLIYLSGNLQSRMSFLTYSLMQNTALKEKIAKSIND